MRTININQGDRHAVSTTLSCDACKAEYTQKFGECYDAKNYPGTGWMTIQIEGEETDAFNPIHICRQCSEWIKIELMLHNIEGRKNADAKTVAASESKAEESR
jgi:hypothetical protein